MPLDPIALAVDSALLASQWAETVTYRRPGNVQLAAVAAFPIAAIIETGGEYANPTGPMYADIFLQVGLIPLGPQKGDQILVADSAIQSGTYLVQEIFWDRKAGSAHLKVRWTGP